ncbi:MAG: transglycosylase SLT domain-containing protein [Bdellovibrionota bacterium]
MTISNLFSKPLFRASAVIIAGLMSVGLDRWEIDQYREKSILQELQKQTLVINVLEHPLIYKKEKGRNIWGQDYEILRTFAAEKGLKLKFVAFKNAAELFESYKSQNGDIWVHRWPTFRDLPGDIVKGPDLRESSYVALCSKSVLVKKTDEIRPDANPRYVIRVDDLAASENYFSNFLKEVRGESIPTKMNWGQIAAAIKLEQADCTFAEQEMASWLLQKYSFLRKVVPQDDHSGVLSWWLNPKHTELSSVLHSWYHQKTRKNAFHFHSHEALYSTLAISDLTRFQKSIDTILPEFADIIKDTAQEFELPWQLVAAVAYQESHWNPTAVSYTGATGFMQLTSQTAVQLGIEDREDPGQNIWGGSKYIADLFKRTSMEAPLFDRLAITLASYNLGWGHVLNLQKIAREEGLDPWRWKTIKSLLPRLSEAEYKARFYKNGARGHEALAFVERTLSFYHILLSI